MEKKQAVYLPLRSLGDLVPTMTIIKATALQKVPIMLPDYLEPLFTELNGADYFDVVDRLPLKRSPIFFEVYRIKSFAGIKTLFSDSAVVKKHLCKDTAYLLDDISKRLFFLNADLRWPECPESNSTLYGNIYRLKYQFFSKYFDLRQDDGLYTIKADSIKAHKVVIFPESKVAEKRISESVIEQIKARFAHLDVVTARFSSLGQSPAGEVFYGDFSALRQIINDNDFIISADSLPYHMANFFEKPHFVIYNKTKYSRPLFQTPFIADNHFYCELEDDNTQVLIKQLHQILV
jgi:ADP-heptose:LPS heptosyltransferase